MGTTDAGSCARASRWGLCCHVPWPFRYTLSYFARADYLDLMGRWQFIVWGYGHWVLAKKKHWSLKAFVLDLQQKVWPPSGGLGWAAVAGAGRGLTFRPPPPPFPPNQVKENSGLGTVFTPAANLFLRRFQRTCRGVVWSLHLFLPSFVLRVNCI